MITSKMTQEDKLKEAFQMFDRNGDGRISATEVKEVSYLLRRFCLVTCRKWMRRQY